MISPGANRAGFSGADGLESVERERIGDRVRFGCDFYVSAATSDWDSWLLQDGGR